MAELTIVFYPEPILRTKGESVRAFGQPLRSLAEDMLVAMRAAVRSRLKVYEVLVRRAAASAAANVACADASA
jgi:peptide deformylase